MPNLVNALQSGFTIGRQAAGAGRFAGLSSALRNIADSLRSQREATQETQNVLGMTEAKEQIKSKFKETPEEKLAFERKKIGLKPSKYGVEALAFEKAKVSLKPKKVTGQITPTTAMNIISDPFKAIQYKKEWGTDAFEELKVFAQSGLPKKSFLKKPLFEKDVIKKPVTNKPEISIMDTNF